MEPSKERRCQITIKKSETTSSASRRDCSIENAKSQRLSCICINSSLYDFSQLYAAIASSSICIWPSLITIV